MIRCRGPGGAPYRPPAAGRSSPRTAILSTVIVLVLAAAGVVGWALNHRDTPSTAAPPTHSPSSSSAPSAAASIVLTPVSANSFDALGNDGGNEDGAAAKYAIDNNPSTFWHTDYYLTYPALGNLKKGTGLILDMGKQVRLSQVVVQFGASCCADVEIEIGNNNTPGPVHAGHLHRSRELHERARQHHLQREQQYHRPLRADLDYPPPAADRIGSRVRGADL